MIEVKKRGRPPKVAALEQPEAQESNPAQEYAERVWDGQSQDLPRGERLRRVQAALEGQGLSMEGVTL